MLRFELYILYLTCLWHCESMSIAIRRLIRKGEKCVMIWDVNTIKQVALIWSVFHWNSEHYFVLQVLVKCVWKQKPSQIFKSVLPFRKSVLYTIWTFSTSNLLLAVMSQRQAQKLKCLFEKYFTVIKSILENRGYIYAPINPGDVRD